MKVRLLLGALFAFLTMLGCGRLTHASSDEEQRAQLRPEAVKDFTTLYEKNCSGCHGARGQFGPATPLANPLYEAVIDDDSLRDVIAKGQKGTLMPAFAKSVGGSLTDEQIQILVQGIRKEWPKGDALQASEHPPYKATLQGDVDRGRQVYGSNCSRCHGPEQGPPGKAGAILDGSFLGLIADQTVRTTAIVGRPDLGMPDFRNQMQGRAMTDQDITDVVAFVMSHRPKNPGQPYPDPHATPAQSSPNTTTQGKK